MIVISDKTELHERLADWRHAGEHVAIVPTMGSLHAGHISLVSTAREQAERVVVTVFVNPTQFGDGEDYESYPRSFDKDTRRLRKVSADVLFSPDVDTVYPFGLEEATRIHVPGLTENFCGAFRPGHFDGVTTVVARLFALVQPDVAVFGQKDYQQQLVVKRMVEDLSLPIDIVTAPTVREDDGLAMSSRNAYLADEERERAPLIYELLCTARDALQSGSREFTKLESEAMGRLHEAGFRPEYFAIRRAVDLGEPLDSVNEFVVLTAVWLGKARLIDNVVVRI